LSKMLKVDSKTAKIIGIILVIAGSLLFLLGALIWSKQLMATGFIACLVAIMLLYYGWRIPSDKTDDKAGVDASSKQKL